jgi:putative transposase
VLFRLAYLTITNLFSAVRLLSAGDRGKDAEILALRHQITVLERQLGDRKVRFNSWDRTFLAVPRNRLPQQAP